MKASTEKMLMRVCLLKIIQNENFRTFCMGSSGSERVESKILLYNGALAKFHEQPLHDGIVGKERIKHVLIKYN